MSMNWKQACGVATVIGMLGCAAAFAEETTGEKMNSMKNHAVDATKESARDAADKGCEMINGKLECAGKKLKHKAQTMKDKAGTKIEETKDKAD